MSNGRSGGTAAMENMQLKMWTIGTVIVSLVLTLVIIGVMFS